MSVSLAKCAGSSGGLSLGGSRRVTWKPPTWSSTFSRIGGKVRMSWNGGLPKTNKKLARGEAEPPAEQPTERAQALETDGESNGRDLFIRSREQPAGGTEAVFLQKLHGGLAERPLEHAVKMVGGHVSGPRRQCHR